MAVSIDDVYKTVLLILNKEQRGYITPPEFNKLSQQVQLEIFEKYFEDFNQQFRVPQNNSEYGNRLDNLDEKMSIFKDDVTLNFINLFPATSYWTTPSSVYFIGDLYFQNETTGRSYLIERVDPGEAILRNNSNYTRPTSIHPIYTQQGAFAGGGEPTRINLYGPNPNTFNLNSIRAICIRKPNAPIWGYNVIAAGQPGAGAYTNDPLTTIDFELHPEEQTNIVMQILMYAGVVIRDPQIVQNAAQMINQEQVNEKS
jgi:hypothetical protein